MSRILILNRSSSDADVYRRMGRDTHSVSPIAFINDRASRNLRGYDAVVFTGGSDIPTELYDERTSSYGGYEDMRRDRAEIQLAHHCLSAGIPTIGICRGAQLLNVLNGGKLVQHVTNHVGSDHLMITSEGEEMQVNSLHHQMMIPSGEYEILGYTPPISTLYLGEDDILLDPYADIDGNEPEIIWFSGSRSLCVQWHPEFMHHEEEARVHFHNLVDEYIY